jgi:hypothetical protein
MGISSGAFSGKAQKASERVYILDMNSMANDSPLQLPYHPQKLELMIVTVMNESRGLLKHSSRCANETHFVASSAS